MGKRPCMPTKAMTGCCILPTSGACDNDKSVERLFVSRITPVDHLRTTCVKRMWIPGALAFAPGVTTHSNPRPLTHELQNPFLLSPKTSLPTLVAIGGNRRQLAALLPL
ncbi:hypothetical protein DFH07DRAFT_763462 [Mycena maculata]|uniref:Uncharacterized protein n=1 Tax=Mycena maculata TaxID=230809 RepID=A0AAD7P2D2_9AGAR|nr:hypothetical protein DFH07DRAFT_763462 [Mycena maculata]